MAAPNGWRFKPCFSSVWRSEDSVKVYLTVDQVSRLLRIDGRCNLLTVRSIQSTEFAHMNIQVIQRVAEGLLAVGVTAASVLALQFAMLVG
jgi:hypothetical protein